MVKNYFLIKSKYYYKQRLSEEMSVNTDFLLYFDQLRINKFVD